MRLPFFPCALAFCLMAGCGPAASAPDGDTTALADTLKQLIEEAYDFTQPDVVARMTALYPDTGRIVSASGGNVISAPDSVRLGIARFWQEVGQNMRNPKWTWGAVHVDRLGQDGAVLTATWSIPHIAPDNNPHVIGGAWTAVFRRMHGDWKIVQEHLSVPNAP